MADLSKKRDLMPKLQNCIEALVNLSFDVAKLELSDNNQASVRVKRNLAEFKNTELKDLTEAINETRSEIITRPKSASDGRANNGRNLPVRKASVGSLSLPDPEKNDDNF